MSTERAVTKAVNDCIGQGILREFLLKYKAQVIKMSIYEYDEKKQRQYDKEEGIVIGDNIRLIIQIQKKLNKGKSLDAIADELETTVEEIKPIYDAVIKHPLDTEPKDIIAHL